MRVSIARIRASFAAALAKSSTHCPWLLGPTDEMVCGA